MKDCDFCENPVNTDDSDNYVQVSSWVNGPKLDGPKLRMQTGKVAHKQCIRMQEAGQAVDQPDIFSSDPAPKKSHGSGVLCDSMVKKGTGLGICSTILDTRGECPNATHHLEV